MTTTLGIGILEISWKVIELIINLRIGDKVTFHNVFLGFRAWRGTGTACIEANLLLQLSKMVQKTQRQEKFSRNINKLKNIGPNQKGNNIFNVFLRSLYTQIFSLFI